MRTIAFYEFVYYLKNRSSTLYLINEDSPTDFPKVSLKYLNKKKVDVGWLLRTTKESLVSWEIIKKFII